MRDQAPFQASDLEDLDARLLSRASRVIPLRDVYKGDADARAVALRHDVDDNIGSLGTALQMAEWEFEHGYSSTYFLLHGSHYWGEEMFAETYRFEELGHEVGIHVNAIAEGLRQRQDPSALLSEALSELRASGVRVVGCVAHGDQLCHKARFVNDEMFSESPRPAYGAPDRIISDGTVAYPLKPVSRRAYQLEYDANWLSRGDYLSDSGGEWSRPFGDVARDWPARGQLHMLIHPDWWGEAFAPVEVAA